MKKEYIILIILIIGTFLLRTLGQLDKVLIDGQVLFRGVDSWYQMRVVDNLMVNFPIPLGWGMFATPLGGMVGYYPLLGWIIAGVSKLTGLNYELVAAFLPPVLGSLILIPVYFLGKELFGKGVALVSCLLIAFIPGELFHRSLLGFTDQHIIESILMVTTVLFVILGYKYGKLKYKIGAGITLGLFALNWHGTGFFLLILGVGFLVEFYRKYLRKEDTSQLCKDTSLILSIGLVISIPYLLIGLAGINTIIAFSILIIGPFILRKISQSISKKVLIISSCTTLVGIIFVSIFPFDGRLFATLRILGITAIFWGRGTTILEASPTDLEVAFNIYGIIVFLAPAGLYYAIKRKGNSLFIVWTIILIIATLGQRRWGYYSTIPIALLSAYLIFTISNWFSQKTRTAIIVIICIFAIMPIVKSTVGIAVLPNDINGDWYNSCIWLRENTPEPFQDPDAYYKLNFKEEADYSILAWWDYGHWIIRAGHRVPLTSPTKQSVELPSFFFTAQSEEEANKVLEGSSVRYIIVSKEEITGKFYAIVKKSRIPDSEIKEIYPNSMVLKLVRGETNSWKEIYGNGTVKIFERV